MNVLSQFDIYLKYGPRSLLDACKLNLLFCARLVVANNNGIASDNLDNVSIKFGLRRLLLGNKVLPEAQFLFLSSSVLSISNESVHKISKPKHLPLSVSQFDRATCNECYAPVYTFCKTLRQKCFCNVSSRVENRTNKGWAA